MARRFQDLIDSLDYLPVAPHAGSSDYFPESAPHGVQPSEVSCAFEVVDNSDCDSGDCTGLTICKTCSASLAQQRNNNNRPPTRVAVGTAEVPDGQPDVVHSLMSIVADLRTLSELLDDVDECQLTSTDLLLELLPLLATLTHRPLGTLLSVEVKNRSSNCHGLTASLLLVLQDIAPLGGLLHEIERLEYTPTDVLITLFPLVLSLLGVSPSRSLAMELSEQEFLAKEARRRKIVNKRSGSEPEVIATERGIEGDGVSSNQRQNDCILWPVDLGGEG